ncbi:MAG: hypothetical protein IPL78_27060 [Chloroflexi bacterium]|nr:hypothetical protein [Chloroflexota bacterium]
MVAGSADGRILIWSLAEPEAEPTVLARHSDRVNDLAFSPDGQVLASAGEKIGQFCCGIGPICRRATSCWPGIRPVYAVWPFAPDGTQLVSAGGLTTPLLGWNPQDAAAPRPSSAATAAVIKWPLPRINPLRHRER